MLHFASAGARALISYAAVAAASRRTDLLQASKLCFACLCRGVLNIVHGTHDTVNRILDHPDVAAISFVGGDAAGRYIYKRAAENGKRVQVRWLVVLVQVVLTINECTAGAAGTCTLG